MEMFVHCINITTDPRERTTQIYSPCSGHDLCNEKAYITLHSHTHWYLGWRTEHRSVRQPKIVDVGSTAPYVNPNAPYVNSPVQMCWKYQVVKLIFPHNNRQHIYGYGVIVNLSSVSLCREIQKPIPSKRLADFVDCTCDIFAL